MHNDLLQAAQALEKVAVKIGEVRIKDASAYDRVLQLFFSRVREGFRAVRVLVVEDCGYDAVILVRSLYEDTLSLLYIATDPDRLADLFLDYGAFRNWTYIKYLEKHYPEALASIPADDLQAMEREYERVKEFFPRKQSWHGKSIADLARLLHLTSLHETFYKLTCDVTHGNVAGFYPLLNVPDNRPIGINGKGSDDYAKDALAIAMQCYAAVLNVVNDHFALGLEADLVSVRHAVTGVVH